MTPQPAATTGRAALLLLIASTALHAQQRVTIAQRGPGDAGRILQRVIAGPHRVVEPDTAWFILGRNEQARPSLLVLGRTAAIGGFVDGDVLVVGGDLHVRPGAHIGGRAVAIGGGVYSSVRAIVLGGTRSFPDETYDVTRTTEGFQLAYRSLRTDASSGFALPGIYGLRVPSYDRVNGASVPIGPSIRIAGGRGEVDLLATYRSDLGKVDPSLSVGAQLFTPTRVQLWIGRGTFTNDSWIRSDFANSVFAFVAGLDTRNYFRADRADLTVHHLLEGGSLRIEPFVGVRGEDAWSIGPGLGESGSPWSIFGRTDEEEGMRRLNPPIIDGRITSALGGADLQWDAQEVRVQARAHAERSLDAPGDAAFTQVTSELGVSFPTFGLQEYRLEAHSVTTFGDTPPPQRFAYLGGSGTLAFLDLLEQGGDELLHVEQLYSVPLSRVNLGLLGVPTLTLRHRIGSAGIGTLPDFEQMLGFGIVVVLARAELQVDPVGGEVRFSAGVSFAR